MDAERDAMLSRLRQGGVRDERVLQAMAAVPRELFVGPGERVEAYADRALPIGCGQTISQPLMVAVMVEALGLQPGERALDVGTGSGYQAAVMAACGAHVVSVERIPALADEAVARLSNLGYDVEVVLGDGSLGVPERAPFDAIAVGAAAPRLPLALARQLREGGRLVVPIAGGPAGEELTRLRLASGRWETESLGPCRFVPLIGDDAYAEA
ncbi:MAG: protein-L-isoaspartate(D-aspartate) O-methyltransferase [Candidatus Dormibacteraeota bacterium]|nr:protein-L-isoaspartate(D-aspartate) O-methyltransferase [Candidatus Dormibacteraeota bacterium]MBV9525845.1 protein-L-isoaspartate(D-aspartate) O-methyltransferase [Candidatus Dormibacteraeota bacterium]